MLNKLENMLNELKQVLESKKELLKNLLNDKKINDNKEVTKEQVLKDQEINSKIYDTEFSIEKFAGDVKEQERLIEEAKDYLNNKSIVYEDFLTLCDIYNIKVAARTKGHLKNADACIKLDGYTLPKKMRVSDTVLKLSEELYNALLQDQEPEEDKINDLLEDTEVEKVKKCKNNVENIETLKEHIVIKHKEIKDLFFNNSTDAIFNIELDKLLSNMLIDEIKLRNKKGYRLEAYINDNKYIDFINSIINILKSKDDLKTFDNYSYQELMSIMNDLKYDDKLIKKYNNKFIKLKEDIKEEFHINETAADPGTNIKCLYSITHENDDRKKVINL